MFTIESLSIVPSPTCHNNSITPLSPQTSLLVSCNAVLYYLYDTPFATFFTHHICHFEGVGTLCLKLIPLLILALTKALAASTYLVHSKSQREYVCTRGRYIAYQSGKNYHHERISPKIALVDGVPSGK